MLILKYIGKATEDYPGHPNPSLLVSVSLSSSQRPPNSPLRTEVVISYVESEATLTVADFLTELVSLLQVNFR